MSAATQSPLAIAGHSLSDDAAAIVKSLGRLKAAAANAAELLHISGFAGLRGDTADDLRQTLASHEQLVHEFNVKVRTKSGTTTFCTCAFNAAGAVEAELERQGDTPCGITVTPAAEPDRQTLAAAQRVLRVAGPLDKALNDPSIGRAIRAYARKHPVRHTPTMDFKSLAANDRD